MRFYFVAVMLVPYLLHGQPKSQTQYITTDITNFWQMFDQLAQAKTEQDTINLIQTRYLIKMSTGLGNYIHINQVESKIDVLAAYLKMIRNYSDYLHSIRAATESIPTYEPLFNQTYQQLTQLYSPFKVPKAYFSIGFLNGAARSFGDSVLYIGAEFSCVSDKPDFRKTPLWLPSVTTSVGRVNEVLAHEATHNQQARPATNPYGFLYNAWVEGGAVLMVDLITRGKKLVSNAAGINERTYQYGMAHEKELWQEFKADLLVGDIRQDKWFYNGATPERPKDLGYFIGYRMCLAYYNQAKDKQQAIKDILSATDYSTILKRSNYEETLKKR